MNRSGDIGHVGDVIEDLKFLNKLLPEHGRECRQVMEGFVIVNNQRYLFYENVWYHFPVPVVELGEAGPFRELLDATESEQG